MEGPSPVLPFLNSRLRSYVPRVFRSPVVLLVALSAVLFFWRLGHRELYSSHEARAAQNAQRMLDSGEWGLPTLFDGRVDLQKPPGYYWAVAAVGWLNQQRVEEWVARFPAALAGFACVLLVYGFLSGEGRAQAALLAAIALATTGHFLAISRTARIDVPLTLTVSTALLAFYRGCYCTRAQAVGWHLLAAVAAGLAVLLKGLVGLALIGPVAVIWFVAERFICSPHHRPRLPIICLVLGPLIVLAVSLPWFLWANHVTEGELFRVFFWYHTIARFAGTAPQLASHPWWYYGPRLAVDLLPWTPALIGLAVWAVRRRLWHTDRTLRFGAIAFAVMLLVLSSARFKRADYLLPCYPFAAIALGCASEAWFAMRIHPRSIRLAHGGIGLAIVASVIGWAVLTMVVEPRAQANEEKRRFAQAIRHHAPAPARILQFRMESHLLSYHLGQPIHTLVEWGELNERLAVPGSHFVVMPPEYVFAADQLITSRKLVPVTRLEEHTARPPSRSLVFLRTAD